jgi:hypothetical protein
MFATECRMFAMPVRFGVVVRHMQPGRVTPAIVGVQDCLIPATDGRHSRGIRATRDEDLHGCPSIGRGRLRTGSIGLLDVVFQSIT